MKTLLFTDTGQFEQDSTDRADWRLRWIDLNRAEQLTLPEELAELVHDQHLTDLMNGIHPPYSEQTDDYEVIILRSVDRRSEMIEPKTRPIAFLIHADTVISVHDEDDQSLDKVYNQVLKSKKRSPRDLLSLLHLLFDEITDGFLELREPLDQHVSEWQQRLLDPNDPFNDWQVIMQAKSSFGRLNTNLGLQRDALSIWQEQTRYEFNASLTVKFNDIQEHLARMERVTDRIRADLDSVTQVYFASVGQKTNVNVQFLAVVSAIFLPLNLIAGIFGMNFDNIPFLKHPFGPYFIIGSMLLLTGLMLWWFKKNKWF